MMKNPIGWIEIPVRDLDRAEKWYSEFFGFKMDRQETSDAGFTMSWFPMDMESYGSAATLVHGAGHEPTHDGALVYFSAPGDTVEQGLKKAQEMGIKVLMEKTDISPHGFMAIVEDSEGNRIAIHSRQG